MEKILIAYVPVLHEGYHLFFMEHVLNGATALYLFGPELISEFRSLEKDVRAIDPGLIRTAIRSWELFSRGVHIADPNILKRAAANDVHIIMPNEDECRLAAEKYLDPSKVEFDYSVFLRWDQSKSLRQDEVKYDRTVSFDGLVREIMQASLDEAKKATNWWRRVGAVIAKDGQILLTGHNTQVPHSRIQYYEGDPRASFKKGLHIELTTDQHAEARLICEAAKHGISINDADLFITTFPCPVCAKDIAYSGIKRCFYLEGYAMLDGERILKQKNVEIILVQ